MRHIYFDVIPQISFQMEHVLCVCSKRYTFKMINNYRENQTTIFTLIFGTLLIIPAGSTNFVFHGAKPTP